MVVGHRHASEGPVSRTSPIGEDRAHEPLGRQLVRVPVRDARAAATAAVEARTELRRRRQRDTIFEAPLADGIVLWASIEVTRGEGGEETGANLWVGVRHEELERVVAEASGRPPSIAGTIIHPVFALVADARTYAWWPLRADTLADDAARLAGDLADPGLVWASKLDSLAAIAEALRGAYRQDLAWWRLPATLLLLGQETEAAAYVEKAAPIQSASGFGEPGELAAYWEQLRRVLA